MFTKLFWKDAAERAIKTVAQAALSVLTLDGANVLTLNYTQLGAVAVTAGVVSVLTSLVTASVRNQDSASLVANP